MNPFENLLTVKLPFSASWNQKGMKGGGGGDFARGAENCDAFSY